MAMERKTFLFNAKNGVFTADLTDTLKTTPDVMNSLDLSKFKIKEVDFDNTTHYWDGDYDTGSVKPMHDKQIIYERAVNTSANIRVLEKWPLHKQINALIEMLDQADIPNTPKITELKEHIEAIKQETIEMKKVYEEDDAYELSLIHISEPTRPY